MNAGRHPTSFVFDFSRADRVIWSHAGEGRKSEQPGTPAGFFIDDAPIADQFAHWLEPTAADFVDIAMAAHMADRLALRTVESPDNWSRCIKATICLRKPGVWTNTALKHRLENLLTFLTEDVWELAFVPRCDSPRSSEIQTHLPLPRGDSSFEVSLFSGGLDSLAGTAARMSESNNPSILVSASPNPQQRARQQQQVRILREEYGQQVSHLCLPYGMHRGDDYVQEASRRTRGFLFLILGGVTALWAGASALSLFENGLGAMNLPYDDSQIGTDNSRGVHPKTLREVAELLSITVGKPFLIMNRSIFQTKAEMLRHLAIAKIKRAIPLTFSCDGFPVRAKAHAQCGFCTSCLLRRYSLEAAGLADLDLCGYLQDWRSQSFNPTRHHLRGLRAMDWQVRRIKDCFVQQDPWNALTAEFPELRLLVNHLCMIDQETPSSVAGKILRVLKSHVVDWPNFSALQLLTTSECQAA